MKLRVLILLLLLSATASAQRLGVRTNLFQDATATPNLGLEVPFSNQWTTLLSGSANPWTFSGNRKWKLWQAETETRYWLQRPFEGHHFGIRLAGGEYNISRVPLLFAGYARHYRYEGWRTQAGITYGYSWKLGQRWSLEATLGAGWNYARYKKFDCPHCGEFRGKHTKSFLAPTHAGINVVFLIGKERNITVKSYIETYPVDEKGLNETKRNSLIEAASREADVPVPQAVAAYLRPVPRKMKFADTLSVHFRVGEVRLKPSFANNDLSLSQMADTLNALKNGRGKCIEEIKITGYASPEGDSLLNVRLARHRAEELAQALQRLTGLPEEVFRLTVAEPDWEGLAALVEQSDMDCRDEVLAIIRTQPAARRTMLLKKLNGEKVYPVLRREFYPQLRRACHVRTTYKIIKQEY